MLVAVMMLSALALGISCAALAVVLVERTVGRPARTPEPEDKAEEKPWKLSDKKMQEGIANLLGYEAGGASGGDEG